MRIAWFHSHMLHPDSGGTRYVMDYAGGLVKKFGHQVTLFVDMAVPIARERAAKNGLSLVELDIHSTNSPFYYLTLPLRLGFKRHRLAKRMAGFDICVNSMFPMNVLTAGLDMPLVQICYEPFAFFYDGVFMGNFAQRHRVFFKIMSHLYSRLDKKSLRSMDRVLTVNETNVPKFEAVYDMRPEVVYAGIDAEVYHRADADEIQSLRQRYPGSPLLFHSSDLTGTKGSFKLLDVLALLKKRYPAIKLLFTIYVNNPDGTRRFLHRIEELNLQDNCEFLGCLPRQQLSLYYSSVDFVCQPSINQPANWPLKEALLCGTPIVGGIESEEVDEMVNGIRVDVNLPEAVAAKMDTLFQSQGSLKVDPSEMLQKYSFEGCLGKFEKILEDCIADHTRHS